MIILVIESLSSNHQQKNKRFYDFFYLGDIINSAYTSANNEFLAEIVRLDTQAWRDVFKARQTIVITLS